MTSTVPIANVFPSVCSHPDLRAACIQLAEESLSSMRESRLAKTGAVGEWLSRLDYRGSTKKLPGARVTNAGEGGVYWSPIAPS